MLHVMVPSLLSTYLLICLKYVLICEKSFRSEKIPLRIFEVPLLILARNWQCLLYHKCFSFDQ